MMVMSIDGSGAFDLISRKSMLQALMRIEGGPGKMMRGVHNIEQGEGGERETP